MITVCAWCDRYLGGPSQTPVTHGICVTCTARQHWRDSPVLVISRHREAMAPVLLRLLKGSPEVRIVIERRGDDRRQRRASGAPPSVERRSGQDRRRGDDLMLM